jgi:hypothetical protein
MYDDRIVLGSLRGWGRELRLDGFDGNLPETLESINDIETLAS